MIHFVSLQESRHEADYDLGRTFTKTEAVGDVEKARDAILGWDNAEDAPEAERFLVELLVGKLGV